FFFFQAEDGIRDLIVTGVQTCALPILLTTIPAWRAATLAVRARGNPALPSEGSASRTGEALAGMGLPPTTVLGLRMAIEPGRGRSEERRVGKEGSTAWAPQHETVKKYN